MARDRTYEEVAQSALIFFENEPRLWEYGNDKGKWPELEAALDSVKDFHVVNALTQWHQTKIAKLVDSSVDLDGSGIVNSLAAEVNDRSSKAVLLLQGLLQMGANPDLVAPGWGNWTPSHACASSGSVDIARSLVLCRPNLGLKDTNGSTPAAEARQHIFRPLKDKLDVANLFEEAERNGFPTIAQLAQDEKWWAVRNLCRRGIVPEQEKLAFHGGKDAIGWAMHHKQLGMEEELEYLLKGVVQPKNDVVEKRLVALEADLRNSNTEKEAQREHIEQLQLDQAAVKKEVEELKEMLLLNLTKTSQDHPDLKNELTAFKGKHSMLKDDLPGKLDHQSEQLKQMKVDCKEGAASLMQKLAENGQLTQATGPVSASMSVQGNEEEKSARLEADKKALEADKKALQDKVDQLQGVLKAQSALLSSFLKADLY